MNLTVARHDRTLSLARDACFLCGKPVAVEDRILRRHSVRDRSVALCTCRACDRSADALRHIDRRIAKALEERLA